MPARGPSATGRGDGEAAVAERAEGVHLVEPRIEVAGLLAPGERVRCRDPPENLEDAALVDPVLGPRPREVLDARHLYPRHVPGGGEPAHPIPMGVAGEVADDPRPAGHDLDEPLGVVRVD